MNVVPSSPIHCSLCVNYLVKSTEDRRPPALVFLDMDGVMITGRFSDPLNSKIRATLNYLFPNEEMHNDYQWTIAKACHLDPTALDHLQQLIERVKASGQRVLIVLSSAWRNDASLDQHRKMAFVHHKFCRYLCGKTTPQKDEHWAPEIKAGDKIYEKAKDYSINLHKRADEIRFWLLDHGFDPMTANYVVIDDSTTDGLREIFGPRFIRTYDLFRQKHLEIALKIFLSKDLSPNHLAALNPQIEEERQVETTTCRQQ